MKLKTTTYWLTTTFVALILGISGGMSIAHAAPLMEALKHLGYPEYFANILGVGKFIGLIVFLAPGMPRFKEWAYAGFSITVLSACYRTSPQATDFSHWNLCLPCGVGRFVLREAEWPHVPHGCSSKICRRR